MFNAESQPGFKTHERKTKQVGNFSFGRRPTLDVEATPMGTYQAIVYRAIGEQWYRQCGFEPRPDCYRNCAHPHPD